MFVRSIVSPVRAQRLTPLSLLGVRFKSAPATATKTAPAPTKQEESKGAFGDFVRPRVEHGHLVSGKEVPIARPQNPPELLEHGMDQASNYPYTWSEDQRPKSEAMKGPRFEQMAMDFQPNAPSAMELISTHPIQFTTKRVAACDGGKYSNVF